MEAGSRLAGHKPDSLFPKGIEITCQFAQLSGSDPGFNLRRGGSPGRKNGEGFALGDPARFDPRQGVLFGVGKDAELQSAFRKAGS